MPISIDRVRADTPGLPDTTHLIASGAGLMPQPVVAAVTAHLNLEADIGGYEAHAVKAVELDGVYASVARLLNAAPEEIALMENATVAWCHAFYAVPLKPGQRILTCEAEYAANYVAFLQRAKRDGAVIEIVPSDDAGAVDLDALERMVDSTVGLIAMTWIPTNGGLVNPAAEIGRIAQAHGILYLLDACQAIGQMPVKVDELGCDFLSATGRKFLRGPRGTGFLYLRKERLAELEPAMIDHFGAPWTAANGYTLRDDARRFETWENAYALRAGLGAAVDYALEIGLDDIQVRAWGLADELRGKLSEAPGARIRDIGRETCAIVSFTVDGLDPHETVAALRDQRINIGASSPESTRLDSEARGLPVLLRAAPHYYNTSEELDRLIMALTALPRR